MFFALPFSKASVVIGKPCPSEYIDCSQRSLPEPPGEDPFESTEAVTNMRWHPAVPDHYIEIDTDICMSAESRVTVGNEEETGNGE